MEKTRGQIEYAKIKADPVRYANYLATKKIYYETNKEEIAKKAKKRYDENREDILLTKRIREEVFKNTEPVAYRDKLDKNNIKKKLKKEKLKKEDPEKYEAGLEKGRQTYRDKYNELLKNPEEYEKYKNENNDRNRKNYRKRKNIVNTCRFCTHRERWQCGKDIIQMCAKNNKQIKVYNTACKFFQENTGTSNIEIKKMRQKKH